MCPLRSIDCEGRRVVPLLRAKKAGRVIPRAPRGTRRELVHLVVAVGLVGHAAPARQRLEHVHLTRPAGVLRLTQRNHVGGVEGTGRARVAAAVPY